MVSPRNGDAQSESSIAYLRIQLIDHGVGDYVYRVADWLPTQVGDYQCFLCIVHNIPFRHAEVSYAEVSYAGSFRFLSRCVPWGFGQNHNELAEEATSCDILVLLNHDVVFDAALPKFLRSAIEIFDQNPDIGCISPQLIYPDMTLQETLGEEPGIVADVWMTSSPARFLHARVASLRRRSNPTDDGLVDAAWVPFSVVAIRASVFQAVGGFDENFTMYFEDVDFCRRIRKMGYRTVVCLDHRVIHRVGTSYCTASDRWLAWRRSLLCYLKKWHSPIYILVFRCATTLMGLVEICWAFWRRRLKPKSGEEARRHWSGWNQKMRPFRRWVDRPPNTVAHFTNQPRNSSGRKPT